MAGIMDKIGKKLIFCDGGMGSLLQAQGLGPGELPEVWNITHPEVIIKAHMDYLESGADIITTNTFVANELKFPEDGPYKQEKIVRAC